MRKPSPKPKPIDNPDNANKEHKGSGTVQTGESIELPEDSNDDILGDDGFPGDDGFSGDNGFQNDNSFQGGDKTIGEDDTTIKDDATIGDHNFEDVIYEYIDNRSYFFVFGPASAGKTVIMWSIYDYLSMIRGDRYRDRLINLNRKDVLYESEGNKLIAQFDECSNSGHKTFPPGTPPVRAQKGHIPKHLNFEFRPFDESKEDFPFCFMDMAGEDLENIDFNSNKPLPPSIETYIEDVDKKNLCFIYVLDPKEERKSSAKQTALFNAFINLLDLNNHDNTPCLILVSKWDTVEGYGDVKSYLKNEHLRVWNVINSRGYSYAEFSIGKVNGDKVIKYDYTYAERVFNWMYKAQKGYGLDKSEKPKRDNRFVNFLKRYL